MEVIGREDYSPAQVAAWASLAPSPQTLRARFHDGRTALVAVDDADRPVAYGDVEPDGHIDLLYCAPEAAGRGVASAIAARLEDAARASGATRVSVEASEAARRLFLRRGFRELHRRDLDVGGVAIHNHAMEKDLGAGAPGPRP